MAPLDRTSVLFFEGINFPPVFAFPMNVLPKGDNEAQDGEGEAGEVKHEVTNSLGAIIPSHPPQAKVAGQPLVAGERSVERLHHDIRSRKVSLFGMVVHPFDHHVGDLFVGDTLSGAR